MDTHGAGERDYYQILGVLRTATGEEISAAYYLLARRHHPDVSPSGPDALAQIKLINEAYDVLSDEEKRQEYDRRHRVRSSSELAPRGFPAQARSSFARFKNSAAATPADVVAELPITPEEARYGGWCDFTLTLQEACEACAGPAQVAGAWCSVCQGQGQIRRRRRLQFNLPAGVQTGTVIRLGRRGARQPASAGDLLLRIHVRPCW